MRLKRGRGNDKAGKYNKCTQGLYEIVSRQVNLKTVKVLTVRSEDE